MLATPLAAALLQGAPALATLDPQGPVARDSEQLWWLMFWLGVVTFLIVVAVLFRGMRRGRDDAPAEDAAPPPPDPGQLDQTVHRMVPWGGVVLPVVGIGVVLVATLVGMRSLAVGSGAIYLTEEEAEAAEGTVVVEVTGHRWWWEVHYPTAGITTANEVHIPVHTDVEVRLVSADVVHSFWVPRLAGKVDALPDYTNRLHLVADEAGEYVGHCAEFCGLQHAHMGFVVVAHPAEEFQTWVADQQAPADPPQGDVAERGQEVFEAQSCTRCHTVTGATGPATGPTDEHGPDLTHFATRRTIAAATLPNTPDALLQWLTDPQHVKPGTQMQPVDAPPEELDALLAYLQGLS